MIRENEKDLNYTNKIFKFLLTIIKCWFFYSIILLQKVEYLLAQSRLIQAEFSGTLLIYPSPSIYLSVNEQINMKTKLIKMVEKKI